jgi:ABC-2 type transport system ATP-binding protein
MMDSTLRASGLVKRYRRKVVLDGLDIDVAPGEVTVLLGRNGAGKTTFMRLVLGVLKANAGTISVCGADPLRRPKQARRAIGFVPDRPDVYDWMTPRSLYRFLKPQYPTWNAGVVERVTSELDVPMDTSFKGLSAGEGMKAMLVAALAPEPPLLLLDEPFASLDPVSREEVLRGVIGELRAGNRTVLCATHDLEVASRIADRVAVLADGKIATHGTLDEVVGAGEEPGRAPTRMRKLLAEVSP